MKLIAIIGALGFAMTFCNLSEKLRSGSQPGPGTSNQAANSAPAKGPDRDSVKNELVRLVNDIADASVDGDIAMLSKVTTDDFQITDVDGKVQNKNEALADVKKEKSIKSWTITEAELSTLTDDTAVLKYLLSLTLKNGRSGKARITDTFTGKDGNWLLRSSQQTMVK
ncbi:MAG: nuclear transport factor 2 family protein [Acidobacteria bacterium]|nr:nuclear transport factor 2 family protein [Acidobacteriota bacterium]